MHNTNRWLPHLERIETPTHPDTGRLSVNPYFTQAATTFDSKVPGSGGIPELWGRYDLDLVIQSAQKASVLNDCPPFTNPFNQVRPDWAGRRLIYDVKGKVKSKGVVFSYTQNLQKYGLAAGFYLPYMEVRSSTRFRFNPSASDPLFRGLTQPQIDQLDEVRRTVHESIGLEASDFRAWDIGELDLYLRQYNRWDYVANMRAIYLNFQLGVVVPTGKKRDTNNAAAIPFGTNGRYALHGDALVELELKQDWHLGFVLAFNGQFSRTAPERIPVCCREVILDAERDRRERFAEPLPYSSVIGDLKTAPGITSKFQTYFAMDHLTDGLSFLVRYTRLRQRRTDFTDKRPAGEQSIVPSSLEEQQRLSRWYSTFLTLHATYDTADGGKNWPGRPSFYAVWDAPVERFGGRRAVKTHQFTLGASFSF